MAQYVGVDGCRSGWFAAWMHNGEPQGKIFPSITDVRQYHSDAIKMLVDIPIGLLGDTERQVEGIIRGQLGPRRSSVFPVPCHEAAYAPDYATANQLNRRHLGKGLSKQAWFISHKIREVNDYLMANPDAVGVLAESHPELCFATLCGQPLSHNKKSEQGVKQRLEALQLVLPRVDEFIEQQMKRYKRRELSCDDCLDALVLLATASRALSLNGPVQLGVGDIPIQLWIPAS